MIKGRKACFQRVVFCLSGNSLQRKCELNSLNKNMAWLIDSLIEADSGVQQLQLTQKLHQEISFSQHAACLSSLMDILCEMYFQISVKVPLKKKFLRLLESIYHTNKCLVASMTYAWSIFLSNKGTMTETLTAEICAIFDIRPFGREVIHPTIDIVNECLSLSLRSLLDSIRPECGAQKSSEAQYMCQLVFRAISQMLQNFQETYEVLSTSKSFVREILTSALLLLEEDYVLPNCRLNAAIVFVTLLKLSGEFDLKVYMSSGLKCHTLINIPYLESFPVLSQICLFCGFMASHTYTSYEFRDGTHETILERFVSISEQNRDPDVSLHCARGILQWVLTTKDIAGSTTPNNALKQLFSVESSTLHTLAQYVISYVDHFVDSLRHLVKEIFKNLLALYSCFNYEGVQHDPFLASVCLQILNMSCHVRGKYVLLSILAESLGASILIDLKPSLPRDLYYCLGDAGLSSHVTELCQVLYRKSSKEVDAISCEELWLKPLFTFLQPGTKEHRIILQHILPKFLEANPSSSSFFISRALELSAGCYSTHFTILITCLKYAEVDINFDCDSNKKFGDFCLPENFLENALTHVDDQVRLSAFSGLFEAKKSTKVISKAELDLIKKVLPWNMCSQCPSYRQQFVALFKKFLLRLKENCKMFSKSSRKCCNSSVLDMYENFLKWLESHLLLNLFPGANFPRRVTTFSLLHSLFMIFTDSGEAESVLSCSSTTSLQTLFEGLKDTYENNKQLLLDILKQIPSEALFRNVRSIPSFFEVSTKLLSSTKPPDSVTVSYILTLLTISSPCETDVKGIIEIFRREEEQSLIPEPVERVEQHSFFVIIELLMGILSNQLSVAKRSLLEAASSCPMYGVLTSIRYILSQVQFGSVTSKKSVSSWQLLLSSLIALCLDIAGVVEPIVCNSSPEGHIPMDTGESSLSQIHMAVKRSIGYSSRPSLFEGGSSELSDDFPVDVVKARAVTAQMLLLCSWRTHKEVSLLFGAIAEKAATDEEQSVSASLVISNTQLQRIGRHFITQLSQLKHRGAFEQAYVGFHKLCFKMWRSKDLMLASLPHKWLKEFFSLVSGDSDSVVLCSTRRSAGLPFMMQALLVSEPEVNRSGTFKTAINSLLSMAMNLNLEWAIDSQVHALNVLRALYRDSSLGESVMPYVSDGLKGAILGFKSSSWAVRNASTLLFSSLMNRVFGVNRSREDVPRKNCLTGRIFFSRFPEMFEFLSGELKLALSLQERNTKNNMSLVPSLYPVLLILGRLYPSPVDGFDSAMKISIFIPLVMQCARSCIWNIRASSAKALVPLLSFEDFEVVLDKLFGTLPACSESFCHNFVHGILLQIGCIFKEIKMNHLPLPANLKEKVPKWIECSSHLGKSCNPSYITRAAFMEIVCFSLAMQCSVDADFSRLIISDLVNEMSDRSKHLGKEQYLINCVIFFFTHLLCLSPNMKENRHPALEDIDRDVILSFLGSSHSEVSLISINILLYVLSEEEDKEKIPQITCSDDFSLGQELTMIMSLELVNEYYKLSLKSTLQSVMDSLICISVKMERHTECLAKIFALLFLLYDTEKNMPRCHDDLITLSQKLMCIVKRMNETKKEDARNCMLLYSGKLGACLLGGVLQVSFDCNGFLQHPCTSDVKVSLDAWNTEIEKSASSDSTIEKRKTVLHVLSIAKGFMLSKVYESIGHKSISGLWQALLLLLIDDEPNIKNEASYVVAFLKHQKQQECLKSENISPAVPTLALDDLIKIFIECFNFSYPSYTLGVLLKWMLFHPSSGVDDLEDMDDEQPFDKGEMNVFSEDFTLLQLVAKHFKDVLLNQHDSEYLLIDCSLFSATICSNSLPNVKTVTHFNKCRISEIALFCVTDLLHTLQAFQNCPFLNKQFDHQLLKISKCIYVLWCLSSVLDFGFINEHMEIVLNYFSSFPHKSSFLIHLENQLAECMQQQPSAFS